MSADAWLSIAVTLAALALLVFTRLGPDLVLVAGLSVLLLSGALSPLQALSGFADPGLATVGVLYVVVAGLTSTGAVQVLSARLLGAPTSLLVSRLRLMVPVTAISAFLNNTPVVAMMMPVLQDWCRRHRQSVSHYMIPLSYAAILGGTCTLVGTSTNLIVHGMVLRLTDLGPMGFFEIGQVGLPVAVAGVLFVTFAAPLLLPERRPPFTEPAEAREYVLELAVPADSALVGSTIEEAGLRHLPGAFVAEIERADRVLPAVSPAERLQAGDRLMFVGIVDSVADLAKRKGLVPVPDQLFKLDTPRPERRLVEAVVSDTSPVVGTTIRAGRFRSRYGAVIIAVARNGERLRAKIGDIVLRPGDTLLLETGPEFRDRQRFSRDFFLLSELRGWTAPRHERAGAAGAILAAMVLAAGTSALSMLEAALAAAALMLLARCTTASAARAAIDWQVLIAIGASLGLGESLRVTGAAEAIAGAWLAAAGTDPFLALVAVYAVTVLFTEVITNNAAAVIVFPIAQATAAGLGVSLWPFVVAVMMAASASFATPIGYQTNLMVSGPGGYRFTDFTRIGLPLNLLVGAITVTLAPVFWPF